MPRRRLEYERNFCMRILGTPLFMPSIAIVLSVGSMFEERNDPTPGGSIPMHQKSNMNAIKTAFRSDSMHRTYSDTTQTDIMPIGSRLTIEEVEQLTSFPTRLVQMWALDRQSSRPNSRSMLRIGPTDLRLKAARRSTVHIRKNGCKNREKKIYSWAPLDFME